MLTINEHDAIRLQGRVEVIADRKFSRAAAINRCATANTKGLLPGGKPIVIELEDRELSKTGRRVKRYLACWHTERKPS